MSGSEMPERMSGSEMPSGMPSGMPGEMPSGGRSDTGGVFGGNQ
jgi:hypothetical protein